jgi:three-Cys-motif partner protein
MAADGFHGRPFDEGTLTKLDIFELYARAWLPVFLSQSPPQWRALHIFDFFAGPGHDSAGTPGSPLRLLTQLREATSYRAWSELKVNLHFFDADPAYVSSLRTRLETPGAVPLGVTYSVDARDFEVAFHESLPILKASGAAKLVFIDQFGVDQVDDQRFRELVRFPACDFIFFISSSTLYRFRNHPAIKQKIQRPDDYSHVHRAVLDYYRDLIPNGVRCFLAPFSIKKGANIWGIIFGSGHPRGIEKFLQVAWKKDAITGEANFDIQGDWKPGLFSPTKVDSFQQDLEQGLMSGQIHNERDALNLVFRHGVKPQHAEPVFKRLRAAGAIKCSFWVPQSKRYDDPRLISLTGKESSHG